MAQWGNLYLRHISADFLDHLWQLLDVNVGEIIHVDNKFETQVAIRSVTPQRGPLVRKQEHN